MRPIKPQTQLKSEDLLWTGLTFPVLDERELALQQSDTGEWVQFHRGVWWRRIGYSFCMPVYVYRHIDHEKSWPTPIGAVAGFTHLASSNSPSNGTYRSIVNDSVKEHSIGSLSVKTRRHVRSGLAHLSVRPVEHQEDFAAEAHEVYVSWHRRAQWGSDKSARGQFAAWMNAIFRQARKLILGAYVEARLVAFMLPYATGSTAFLGFAASHSAFLEFHPNDALNHAFLTIARQTPGIDMADFGPVCNKTSLNEFKLHYGRLKEFRSYTKINPLLRPFIAGRLRRRYPWLGLDQERSC
jgi:hypothetical protein